MWILLENFLSDNHVSSPIAGTSTLAVASTSTSAPITPIETTNRGQMSESKRKNISRCEKRKKNREKKRARINQQTASTGNNVYYWNTLLILITFFDVYYAQSNLYFHVEKPTLSLQVGLKSCLNLWDFLDMFEIIQLGWYNDLFRTWISKQNGGTPI